ncbi:hypothetical protein [Haloferula sp.]|uniref:hypothetical protein n=1 Tax=Haloferula sp. TaxID=2497595 RepID=UPI003C708068
MESSALFHLRHCPPYNLNGGYALTVTKVLAVIVRLTGSVMISSFFPRATLGGICLAGGIATTFAEVTDPVGYMTLILPAESTGILSINLVKYNSFIGTVTTTDGATLSFDRPVPSTLFHSYEKGTWHQGYAAFCEVREGNHAGINFRVDSFSENTITLNRSPDGLIDVGDSIGVRPEWTLGEIVDRLKESDLQAGTGADEADIIGTWDAETQTARGFFLHTNGSLLEIGEEPQGDRSATIVHFPDALSFTRRGETEIKVIVIGAVPMPFDQFRYLPVWPGRNLLSGPFTSASSVEGWGMFENGSPFSVLSGPSAPTSDTLRLTLPDGSESPLLYHRQGLGWRMVGESGSGAETPIDLTQAIDFRRVGPAGFIKFAGTTPESPSRLRALANVDTVPVESYQYDGPAVRLNWKSIPGQTYQIQTRALGTQTWKNLGTPVTANDHTSHTTCEPTGTGAFRLIKQP